MNNVITEKLYREISPLPNSEKVILLSKLMLEISMGIKKSQEVSIYDIKGVGKEIWEGIDAQKYVNNERASWR